VTGVSDAERDVAWRRILLAAKTYGVTVDRVDWRLPVIRYRNTQNDRNVLFPGTSRPSRHV